jgi:hypothetical protein
MYRRKESDYYTHKKSIIGIEITNNSPETKNIRFLGLQHRHFRDKSISLKNIFDDTLFDDGELTMLINWIQSVGAIRVMMTSFNTSLSYRGFGDKCFSIKNERNGASMMCPFHLTNYRDPQQLNQHAVSIPSVYVLDFFTELSQTEIEAGERLVIIFHLNPRERDSLDTVIAEADKVFNKEKKRKILLII